MDKKLTETRLNKFLSYVSISTMAIEGIFFFGIAVGWPNLAEILKAQGVFAATCETNDVNSTLFNCPERDELFTAGGTLGSITMNSMVFPLGLIFDRYGSFITRYFCSKI